MDRYTKINKKSKVRGFWFGSLIGIGICCFITGLSCIQNEPLWAFIADGLPCGLGFGVACGVFADLFYFMDGLNKCE